MILHRQRGKIIRDGNMINVSGGITISDLNDFLRAVRKSIAKEGHRELILDFSKVEYVDQKFMLPALPILCRHREEDNASFIVNMPEDENIEKLFRNSNWAHFVSPDEYAKKEEGSYWTNLPARQFKTSEEHDNCVNETMSLLIKILDLEANSRQLTALEWALGEITDNVLNHASSPVGGFIQIFSHIEKNPPYVEFMVADAGIGIPASLNVKNHEIALEKAIQEGVTRDSNIGAGNGLYGTYRLAVVSGGRFGISSYDGVLICRDGADIETWSSRAPYFGTSVVCSVVMDKNDLLTDALIFGGRRFNPDSAFIAKTYPENDVVKLNVKEEFVSFRSRPSGRAAMKKIKNILAMSEGGPLEFDFANVQLISSSFADEVFGKLFTELGAMQFMRQIKFKNLDSDVEFLINRAIAQRTKMDLENGGKHNE